MNELKERNEMTMGGRWERRTPDENVAGPPIQRAVELSSAGYNHDVVWRCHPFAR